MSFVVLVDKKARTVEIIEGEFVEGRMTDKKLHARVMAAHGRGCEMYNLPTAEAAEAARAQMMKEMGGGKKVGCPLVASMVPLLLGLAYYWL